MSAMELEELSPGIYEIESDSKKVLATRNITPGINFYGEQLISICGEEFRSWSPYRSKLAAAILKGMVEVPLSPGDKLLYLGVASGTTCSHISDIVGLGGHIWAVDFAPRPLRDMIENLARRRVNVSPILGDAWSPELYSAQVPRVDAIYADVAQPDQATILAKNSLMFLKRGGWAMMAVKSRSIDVARHPSSVYAEQIEVLKMNGFEVTSVLELEPFERDHAMVLASYKA